MSLKRRLKEDIQKQLNESQENMDKKFKKAENKLNELIEDFNKHQKETKEIIFFKRCKSNR
jgi:hypothetical protein